MVSPTRYFGPLLGNIELDILSCIKHKHNYYKKVEINRCVPRKHTRPNSKIALQSYFLHFGPQIATFRLKDISSSQTESIN